MERREKARRPHRMQVSFWELGSDKRKMGYTLNVSSTGLYITTSILLPRGTRIRVELTGSTQSYVLEAEVARVFRSQNNLRPSGMGVHFLTPAEVIRELLTPREATPAAVTPTPPPPSLSAAARSPLVSPLPTTPLSAPGWVFPLTFNDLQQFLFAYRRDLKDGGLFVATPTPAGLNEVVTVHLLVSDVMAQPLRFEARVVQRFEPGSGVTVAGMGLEILNFAQVLPMLRQLAEQG